MMSVACPGGKGAMMRTGLAGYCWGIAAPAAVSESAANSRWISERSDQLAVFRIPVPF